MLLLFSEYFLTLLHAWCQTYFSFPHLSPGISQLIKELISHLCGIHNHAYIHLYAFHIDYAYIHIYVYICNFLSICANKAVSGFLTLAPVRNQWTTQVQCSCFVPFVFCLTLSFLNQICNFNDTSSVRLSPRPMTNESTTNDFCLYFHEGG